jgi:CubicO group peptidase (beta-lactamase class C family)
MLIEPSRDVDALLETHVTTPHVAPGACAAVCVRKQWGFHVTIGCAGRHAPDDPTAVSVDDWFDLASLTKPLLAYCLARLVDTGRLRPDQTLAELLPWTASTPVARTSLEALLCHRAGLLAHVELFGALRDGGSFDRDAALRLATTSTLALGPDAAALAADPLAAAPLYSDLGFILLGEAVRAAAGVELDALLEREAIAFGAPGLGSSRQWGLTGSARAVPTETVPGRGGRLRGVVHDENAFALYGQGCSGHAGAFGRIRDVAAFACTMLDCAQGRSARLSPRATALLLTERPGGSMRGGFDGKAPQGSSAGDVLSPASFGHLGFTGTSFWCDPKQDLAVVLLTNRVCPSRGNIAIRAARPKLHDALAQLALGRATG